MSDHTITCEEFEALLPDLLEETATDETRAAGDAHLRECLTCAALVADLRGLRQSARHLPALQPSRDLWAGIEARIQSRVIPIGESGEHRTPLAPRRTRFTQPVWLAAAALLLVAGTAGVTYQVAARRVQEQLAIANTPVPQVGDPESMGTPPGLPGMPAMPVGPAASATVSTPGGIDTTRASGSALDRRLVSGPSPRGRSSAAAPLPAEASYGNEIAALRTMISQRRADLDPHTVAILEQNLLVIDRAIAESRAALARDPGSTFLNEELTEALDRKVGLLRTIALLPART